MRALMLTLLLLFLSILKSAAQTDDPLKEFSQLLPGHYSTEAMWKKDSSFSNVQLHIVRILDEDKDGIWFYLEQAEVKNLAKPYRQAILHIQGRGDKIISQNLTIKNRLDFAGAWKNAALLQKLTKAHIEPSEVCDILFTKNGTNRFVGGTGQSGCPNQYKGASYFTNESILTNKSLTSWDRGWKQEGQQAWGPILHGYTFDKIIH